MLQWKPARSARLASTSDASTYWVSGVRGERYAGAKPGRESKLPAIFMPTRVNTTA